MEQAPKRVVDRSDKEVQGWFLTYARCPLMPLDALNALKSDPSMPRVKEWVVARELHQDGTPHLHAFIKYATRVTWGSRRWDIDGYHGEYLPAKSWRAVQKYCMKGGDYITNIDLHAANNKKAARNLDLLTKDPVELVRTGELSIFKLKSLVDNINLLKQLECKALPRCEGFIPNSLGLSLPILTGKKRHYWLWSAGPNKGKTTFMLRLMTEHQCHFLNMAEVYQDNMHRDNQFVLIDEYSNAKILLTTLNSMCDGTYQYPRKNSTPLMLKSPILIVCGNKKPEDVYTTEQNWPLINARFNVIEL